MKKSAQEKKVKELDWAKNCKLKHIVLNDGHTDVESSGERCCAKIPKYCKEAFMNQVGISIPQKLWNNEDLGSSDQHLKAQQNKDDTTKSIDRKYLLL